MSHQPQTTLACGYGYGPPPDGFAPPPPPPSAHSHSRHQFPNPKQPRNHRHQPYHHHSNTRATHGSYHNSPHGSVPFPQQYSQLPHSPYHHQPPTYNGQFYYGQELSYHGRFIAPNATNPQAYQPHQYHGSPYYEWYGQQPTAHPHYSTTTTPAPAPAPAPAPPRPPPPESWNCVTCSKTFQNPEKLENHMKLHEKCPHCDFEAIPKVMGWHQQEMHAGTLKLPKAAESPEEIAKWIEDRKKNWPSAANLARKQAETEAKAAAAAERKSQPSSTKPKHQKLQSNAPCKYFAKGKCFKGSNCPHLHAPSRTGGEVVSPGESTSAVNAGATVVRSTLLKKLLEKDVKQERRILLQCIAYLVENMKE
ncbi:hypothetical protein SeMB42_g04359 [Synchytrium endobioticum]|uniref:C3H1-type domain-containing protein n=1 Tax=Synchytrium endobioticum TaxID=286115 RepID=A0A507CWC9_9FUNG|nr:hypothetical protein SeLEV6574_g05063 [Synchytrium endobioticum]TPX44351.1 hypothetical protein SeMB42_g04359 [Synchytrium endobioticum]